MREKGVVIYLCAPVSTLVGRLEAFPEEGQRPALTAKPLSEEVSDVLAERDALYREAAHHVVDASASPESCDSDYYRPAFGLRQLTAVYTHSSDIKRMSYANQTSLST